MFDPLTMEERGVFDGAEALFIAISPFCEVWIVGLDGRQTVLFFLAGAKRVGR